MSSTASPFSPAIKREKPTLERAGAHDAAKSTLECLIVSTNSKRRELLSQVAADNGWSTLVCSDSDAARRLASRIAVKLAIVDLHGPPAQEAVDLRELSVDLAQTGVPLVVLCGAEGDRQQEIWARQLGVWLYLPGLADSDADGLGVLCGEARYVVERNSVIARAL